MNTVPGPILLLGSGETSPNIRKVYDWLFAQFDDPIRAAILETPAGFEPNSDQVAGEIGDYITHHLQNYRPQISIVPARKKGTPFSPDDPDLMGLLHDANVLLMGPGSPTYAARQLRDSLAWHTLQTCHRLGAALIFASAATLASSAHVLPVYEIYKVGQDLHWQPGLDFFRDYGLNLVFVSHWNNNDGGKSLDTSRCYIGQARFNQLVTMLPGPTESRGVDSYTIVGIDENTALIVDVATESCRVMGPGGIVVMRGDCERRFTHGAVFPLSELGPFRIPSQQANIPQAVWAATAQGIREAAGARVAQPTPPTTVLALVEQRSVARLAKDWAASDALRAQIAEAGWTVTDTPSGPLLEPITDPVDS